MTVAIGQVYKENDPRMEGRTLRVEQADDPTYAWLVVVTNPNDIQAMLDDPDGHPGTRNYAPKDRRGSRTRISKQRLESKRYTLLETPPDMVGATV